MSLTSLGFKTRKSIGQVHLEKGGIKLVPKSPQVKCGIVSSNGKVTPVKSGNLKEKREELERKVHLKSLYSVIQKRFGTLGGGGAGGAIYGEVTLESFQRVVNSLVEKCDFGKDSVFMDIGAGLGKPNFHVAINPGVKLSLGVELIGGRWWQSMMVLESLLENKQLQDTAKKVFLAHANVMDMETFDPVTHVYSFNRGFPPEAMEAVAKAFHASKHSEYFICFNKEKVMEDYGFDVTLVDTVTTKMAGSGEQHRCFVYRRNDKKPGHSISPVKRKKTTAKTAKQRKATKKTTTAAPRLTRSSSVMTRAQRKLALTESSDEESIETIPTKTKASPVIVQSSDEECDHPSKIIREWEFVRTPAEIEYAPHVETSPTYAYGTQEMLKGIQDYLIWARDQVGLDRCQRTTRRRSARRVESA